MNLLDLVKRSEVPTPWAEGDNIPWNEPEFSRRMLKEHLSQSHDLASRRSEKIEQHVEWIHRKVMGGRATQVLDLACGPGLYACRLSEYGYNVTGIDYSPASIEYAEQTAERERHACKFVLGDIRSTDYGSGYGLVMLVYGEFNVFKPEDAALILRKANAALMRGGMLVLEPHTYAGVQNIGRRAASWYTARAGLFSDRPHVGIEESFWDTHRRVATTRYYIVDAETAEVNRYAGSYQAYSNAQYEALLNQAGFDDVSIFPSLAGGEDRSQGDLMAITARKR